MSDYRKIPDGALAIQSDRESSVFSNPTYVHIDNTGWFEDADTVEHPVHIYLYENEVDDRLDEARQVSRDLKDDYVFTTVVVFPDAVGDYMPLDTAVLNRIEWLVALGHDVDENVVESVIEVVDGE